MTILPELRRITGWNIGDRAALPDRTEREFEDLLKISVFCGAQIVTD